jgi:predicted Rossmann-fold nucleotide-binding protein
MSSFPSITRLKKNGIVGIVGDGANECASEGTYELGAALRRLNVSIMTSGGRGVAKAVARGWHEENERIINSSNSSSSSSSRFKPESIAVMWGGIEHYKIMGFPNEYTTLPVYLTLPSAKIGQHAVTSRNHFNECDAVIAFPGDALTRQEIDISVAYEHPIIIHKAFWSVTFASLWTFESIDDCTSLVMSVLRDKEKRPQVHAVKVANFLLDKTADWLREEETIRVHSARYKNELHALKEKEKDEAEERARQKAMLTG